MMTSIWDPEAGLPDLPPLPDYVAPTLSRAQAHLALGDQSRDDRPRARPIIDPEDIWPAPPQTLDDTGLSAQFLRDLLVKILYFAGSATTETLRMRIGLPYDIVERLLDDLKADHEVEVGSASRFNEMGFKYRLTSRGELHAQDALERSRYASIAPVTLDQYTEVVQKQSLRSSPLSSARILEALSPLILGPDTVDNLARALHSGRSTLIFGSSGNGKTAILEQYARFTDDSVIIPNALYVHGQLIRIFDAAVHQPIDPAPVDAEDYGLFKPLVADSRFDQRWLRVRRPVVVVGGELTQESLELSFDPVAHFYQAPPHLKAQDGMFIIDDFGRQRVRPEDLLNRWILPMERGFDLLVLHTGESFTVPFEIALMFSTNLRPADLVDEAFLRRIPYKVLIPSPARAEFREISRRVATAKGLPFTDEQLDHFVETIYADPEREPKGAYPRDLVQIIMDSARYDGAEPELSPQLLERAMQVYFIR